MLQTEDQEYSSQQDEIGVLKAKLRAAEATIAELSSSEGRSPASLPADAQTAFEDSRFPLFRKVQSHAQSAMDKLWAEDTMATLTQEVSDGDTSGSRIVLSSEEVVTEPPATDASGASIEQLFQRYDSDNSGLIDIDEFRQFIEDASRGVVEAIPSFPDFSVGEEVGRFGEWSKETYGQAETMAKDTAKSVAQHASHSARPHTVPGLTRTGVPPPAWSGQHRPLAGCL